MQPYLVIQHGENLAEYVASEVDRRLSVSDESFDHAFGTERRYGLAYEVPSKLLFVVLHPEDLPESFHRAFTVGGCDGEHRGPCRIACREVEAEFFFTVTQEPHELGAKVTVEIEGWR
jgi:hypothetical protein